MSSAVADLEKLYATPGPDIEFAAVLSSSAAADDAALAELIEADGRLRVRNRPVTLERYFKAVDDLKARRDALDAAIDVTLRSLGNGARASDRAIDALVGLHPELEAAIREAATLNAAVWSTTGLRAHVAPRPAKPLPCDFGPVMPDGERRYELQRLLGQGAFGQVYLALDRQLSEEGHTALVAIKVLAARDRSPWARQAMIDEATKVRRINHPNVVLVMDRGLTEQAEDYIVYEFVDGGDLSQLIAGQPRMPVREAARLVAQIARGVHAAHSAGVIHCDLKPGNIMLTSAGQPKVADFGIAVRLDDAHGRGPGTEGDQRATVGPMGNLAFVSPEQYRGDDNALSIPCDVYALGGILYLLLTGALPNGSTPEEIARTHDPRLGRSQPPLVRGARAEVDRDLEAVCRRALAIEPSERYSSAAAFVDDLEHWLNAEPIGWTRPSAFRVARLWSRRKPGLAASLVVTLLVVIAGLAVASRLSGVARQREIEAAINKTKFEEEQKFRTNTQLIGKTVGNTLGAQNPDYRMSVEALPTIWVFEYLYGPAVFGMPDVERLLWNDRIAHVRNLRALSRSAGREKHFEALSWETALGFLLTSDGDYQEAEPLLSGNLDLWRERLDPADDWLKDVGAMHLCATANRRVAEAAQGKADPEAARGLAAKLQTAMTDLDQRHRGTPVHFLVMKACASMYAPELLNDPIRHDELTAARLKLINDTTLKTARRPAPSATQPAPAATQ